MNSSRPYLVRAIYEWLADNELTPYVLVNAMHPGALVPEQFVEDGQIVLNVSMRAVQDFTMDLEGLGFHARFSGVSKSIYVPMMSIQAIYAYENGRGMAFNDDEDDGDTTPPPVTHPPAAKNRGKPQLRVIK